MCQGNQEQVLPTLLDTLRESPGSPPRKLMQRKNLLGLNVDDLDEAPAIEFCPSTLAGRELRLPEDVLAKLSRPGTSFVDPSSSGSSAPAASSPRSCASEDCISPLRDRPFSRGGGSLPVALQTPSSCCSTTYRNGYELTPRTPKPPRQEFMRIKGDVKIIFFDFDGTLTATPGDSAQRSQKRVELMERASLLMHPLSMLRAKGISLGILSKSAEDTIIAALQAAQLLDLFDGPIVGKAVSFEGKVGFIQALFEDGKLPLLGTEGPIRALLVDDDLTELNHACDWGWHTYAAPSSGGLRKEDFDSILAAIDNERLPEPDVPWPEGWPF